MTPATDLELRPVRPVRPAWLRDHRALALLREDDVGQLLLVQDAAGELRAARVLRRELAARPAAVTRFLEVARALQRVSHPNVVGVLDAGTLPDGRPFYLAEYARGRELGELLIDPEPRHHERVASLALELAGGLAAAHAAGVVHGDLTPSNVLLEGEGDRAIARLIDFDERATGGPALGLASEPDAIAWGTPEYWSPEQATGRPLDARSDIYSLGVVLYELLSGRVPFHSHAVVEVVAQHLHVEPPPLVPLPGTVPPPAALVEVIGRCLAKRPGARFQTALELRAALAAVVDGRRARATSPIAAGDPGLASGSVDARLPAHPGTGPTAAGPASASRRRARAASIAVGAVAVALVLGVGGFLVTRPGREVARGVAPAPIPTVRLHLTSEPSGAYVFRASGGPTLGRTPFAMQAAPAGGPLDLVFRFPDGARQTLRVTPDRPARLHVRAAEAGEASATR